MLNENSLDSLAMETAFFDNWLSAECMTTPSNLLIFFYSFRLFQFNISVKIDHAYILFMCYLESR